MDNSTTSLIPTSVPSPTDTVALVAAALNVMLLVTMWSAMLVPLLFALFFFSTRSLRRKPVFFLNVLSILLGLGIGVVCIWYMYNRVIFPEEEQDIVFSKCVVTCFAIAALPLFVESILLCRILAVYTHRSARIMILVPLVSLKIVRMVNISIYMKKLTEMTNVYGPLVVAELGMQLKYTKVAWILQLLDNSIASYLFLRKIDFRLALGTRSFSSRSSKLKTLFWIAASNFTLPMFLDIALLANTFRRNPPIMPGTYLMICSLFVQIIGVLLATVWAAGVQWSDDKHVPRIRSFVPPSIQLPRFGSSTTTVESSSGSVLRTPTSEDKSNIGLVIIH
ncbi:hypothetical protein APHAL10511_000702 [Amanita phalloides]|nr:hypothetical protein APHAL10511_000702 [Amanita phalloides]